jgi:hypothetical protein
MADATKTRGQQLIRTDDKIPGRVRFLRRDIEDVAKASIAEIDVMLIPHEVEAEVDGEAVKVNVTLASLGFPPAHPIVAAAVHGYTQNVLDSSNKLDGQARVDFIRKACGLIQAGGWASAPQDDAKVRENAISGLMKLGLSRAAAEAAVTSATKGN